MGTVVSKSQKKNKVRQNAKLVANIGALQVKQKNKRLSQNVSEDDLSLQQESKPISMVDSYQINDSLLFHKEAQGSSDNTVPYFKAWLKRVEADELCCICAKFTGKKVFPCRICTRVFHEGCLQKARKLNDRESKEAFARSGSADIGWSCHYCENITLLLSDDEMQEIIEYFDQYDINQDTQIERNEYIKIRKLSLEKQNPGKLLSKDDENDIEAEFNMMDRNNTGTIDWWEFVNYEAVKVLGRRDKAALTKMLTKREVEQARDIFHSYDRDEDGYINGYEAMKALERWFTQLKIPNSKKPPDWNQNSCYLQLQEVDNHVNTHMKILMDADADSNRLISWQEYLRDQALYLLVARPNYPVPGNWSKL